ncbi:hypothetical protein HYS54_04645 [Candidatus Micrarchaeota archaeon]|nr:hypothetical protein [Candidatus Micrarchaeota archaeon]
MKKKKVARKARKAGRTAKKRKARKPTSAGFTARFSQVSFVPSGKQQRDFIELCMRVAGADREASKYTFLGESKPASIHERREAALGLLRSLLGLPPESLLLVRKEGNRFTAVDLRSHKRFAAR